MRIIDVDVFDCMDKYGGDLICESLLGTSCCRSSYCLCSNCVFNTLDSLSETFNSIYKKVRDKKRIDCLK